MPDKKPKERKYVKVVVNGTDMIVREETAKRKGWKTVQPAVNPAATNRGRTGSRPQKRGGARPSTASRQKTEQGGLISKAWNALTSTVTTSIKKDAAKKAIKPTAPAKPAQQKPTAKPQGQQRQMPKGTPWYANKKKLDEYYEGKVLYIPSDNTDLSTHQRRYQSNPAVIGKRTTEAARQEKVYPTYKRPLGAVEKSANRAARAAGNLMGYRSHTHKDNPRKPKQTPEEAGQRAMAEAYVMQNDPQGLIRHRYDNDIKDYNKRGYDNLTEEEQKDYYNKLTLKGRRDFEISKMPEDQRKAFEENQAIYDFINASEQSEMLSRSQNNLLRSAQGNFSLGLFNHEGESNRLTTKMITLPTGDKMNVWVDDAGHYYKPKWNGSRPTDYEISQRYKYFDDVDKGKRLVKENPVISQHLRNMGATVDDMSNDDFALLSVMESSLQRELKRQDEETAKGIQHAIELNKNSYSQPSYKGLNKRSYSAALEKAYNDGQAWRNAHPEYNSFINIGGLVYGKLEDTESKKLGIRNPFVQGLNNSIIGTLANEVGSIRTDEEKYFADKGSASYAQNFSTLENIASGATTMLVDLPLFNFIGKAVSVPAKWVFGQASRAVLPGVRSMLGSEAAAVMRQGAVGSTLERSLQSAFTFGGFDGTRSLFEDAINYGYNTSNEVQYVQLLAGGQSLTPEQKREVERNKVDGFGYVWNAIKNAGNAAGGGFVTGASMASGNVANRAISYGGGAARKAAGQVASTFTNAAAMTTVGATEAMLAGEDYDFGKQFWTNVGTFFALEGTHYAKMGTKGGREALRAQGRAERRLAFTDSDISQLNDAGYSGLMNTMTSIYREAHNEKGATELREGRSVKFAKSAAKDRLSKEEIHESVNRMLGDKNVSEDTKKKVIFAMTGAEIPTTAVVDYDEPEYDANGRVSVTYRGKDGQFVARKVYDNDADAYNDAMQMFYDGARRGVAQSTMAYQQGYNATHFGEAYETELKAAREKKAKLQELQEKAELAKQDENAPQMTEEEVEMLSKGLTPEEQAVMSYVENTAAVKAAQEGHTKEEAEAMLGEGETLVEVGDGKYITSGEEKLLATQELAVNHVLNKIAGAEDFLNEYLHSKGISRGAYDAAMEGHSKKEAQQLAGDGRIIETADGKWVTENEYNLLQEYNNVLQQSVADGSNTRKRFGLYANERDFSKELSAAKNDANYIGGNEYYQYPDHYEAEMGRARGVLGLEEAAKSADVETALKNKYGETAEEQVSNIRDAMESGEISYNEGLILLETSRKMVEKQALDSRDAEILNKNLQANREATESFQHEDGNLYAVEYQKDGSPQIGYIKTGNIKVNDKGGISLTGKFTIVDSKTGESFEVDATALSKDYKFYMPEKASDVIARDGDFIRMSHEVSLSAIHEGGEGMRYESKEQLIESLEGADKLTENDKEALWRTYQSTREKVIEACKPEEEKAAEEQANEEAVTEESVKSSADNRARGYDAEEQGRRDIAIEHSMGVAGADAAWQGVVDKITEEADNRAAREREAAKQQQHTDGNYYYAELKETDEGGNKKGVFVVDGKVVMLADGKGIDSEASDKSVVVFDPATGEKKMIAPSSDMGLSFVGRAETPEQRERNIQFGSDEYIRKELDKAQGKLTFEPGEKVTLPTGEQGEIMSARDGRALVFVERNGKEETVELTFDELQAVRDKELLDDYNRRHPKNVITQETEQPADAATETEQAVQGVSETMTPEQDAREGERTEPGTAQKGRNVTEGSPKTIETGMEITLRDSSGTDVEAVVMNRGRDVNGEFVPDPTGDYIQYFANNEVRHEPESELRKRVMAFSEESESERRDIELTPVTAKMADLTNVGEVVLRQGENGEIQTGRVVARPYDGKVEIAWDSEGRGRAVEYTEQELAEAGIRTEKAQTEYEEARAIEQVQTNEERNVRENDLNGWLQNPAVVSAMREYGKGANSVEEIVQRALADNPSDNVREALEDILRFESTRRTMEGFLERGDAEAPESVRSDGEREQQVAQDGEGVSPARQTYNEAVQKFGEKAGKKIDATVASKEKALATAKKNLDKAQDDFDNAPMDNDAKEAAALQKAQAAYDAAKAEKDKWDAVKAEHDNAVAATQPESKEEAAIMTQQNEPTATDAAAQEDLPYHKRPVKDTITRLYSRPEGGKPFTPQQVIDLIEENIKEADKEVKKYANKKPKASADPEQYRRNIAEFEAAKADAEARAEYWRKVKAENERVLLLDESTELGTLEEEPFEPTTIEEHVAQAFYGGSRHNAYKITPESYRRETGYGWQEQRMNVGVIAKAENGGMTVEHCAEKIWEDLPETLQSQYDSQDVRNIILDMAQGGNLAGAVKRIIEAGRRRMRDDYESYMENMRHEYYWDKYHMETEDAIAYEEMRIPDMIDKLSGIDRAEYGRKMAEYYEEQDEVRNLAAEKETETKVESNKEGNGNTEEGYEFEREGGRSGSGSEVLPGEKPNVGNEGKVGTNVSRENGGSGSRVNTDGDVSERASGGYERVSRTDLSEYNGTEERLAAGQGQEGIVRGGAYAGLPGLVENELSRRLSERQRNLYDALAKTLGIEIEFTDGDYSGVYDNNRVRISLETAKDGRAVLSAVLAHEVTHHLKDHVGEDVWNTLEAAVRRAMGDEAFEAAVKDNIEKHNNYIDELRAKGEGNGLSHLTEEGGREETVSYFFQHEALQDEASAVRFLKSLEGDRRTVSQIANAVRDFLLDLWRKLRGTGSERAVKDALDVWENACKVVGADVRERRAATEAVAEAPKSARSDGADVADGRHKVVAAQEAVDKIDAAITDARDKVEASIADKTSRYMDVQAEIRRLTKERDAKIQTLRDRADALKKEYGRGSDELKQQMKPLKEEVKRVDKEYTDALQSLRNERYQLQEEIDAARNSPEYTSETERLKSEYEAAREAYKNTVNDYYQSLRDLPEDARRSALADLSNTLEDFESERLLDNYDAAVEARRDAISDADYEAMDKQSMADEVRRLVDALDDAIEKEEGISVAREALNDYLGHLSDAEFAALRFYMSDKVEFYYGGARLGSSIRENILGDEYKRREERIARSKVSAQSVEKSASLPQVKAKAVKSFDISVAASKDKERKPVLTAVNHEGGWETATDGFILFSEKTGTRKTGLYVKDKKGKESKIEGNYPDYKKAIPTEAVGSTKVNVSSLRDFLSSVKANNAKDFRDGKARVIIRTDYGDYLYNAKLLSQVADFMEKHGIDELQFEGRYGKMVAQNKSAIGLVMPMFFEGTGLEELEAFGYDIRTDKRGERFSLPEREQKRDDEYKKAHDEMQRAKVANSYDKGIDVNYSENGKTKIMRLHTPVSDVENLKATAIKPHSMSRDDQKRLYQSFKPETNVSTGETVEFYTSAFGKNHRENGLFEKIIPQIRELFKESKLIYSEPEQLAGETRRDGTKHKVHRGITGYGNYLNKANIDGKEYYVRFTVQRKKNESGLHSSFVSNVELYNNPVAVAYNPSSNGGRRLDYDRITDAKLKTYFEKSKENANKFSQLTDNPEYTKIISDSESRMREILDEVKRERGYSDDSSYQGTSAFNGAAPSANGYFETKEERKAAYDNGEFEGDASLGDFMDSGIDVADLEFTLHDPRSYRIADAMRRESIDNLRSAVDSGSKTITMYRSVPASVTEGEFRNGDWVTPSRAYAELNAEIHGWGNDYRIIEKEVSVDDVWWDGNDIAEWGYDNGRGEVYKNTENNRKSDDLITYDDNGNIILPSQRFNEGKSDVRFSLPNEREDKKPVFYSNAQRAVEGIRQEKAKAEQWLAMIQKQGGLKAAEDKWLGLSDWLNERKGESLTKQEVLDYIRENDVRVEEVEYINPENNTEFISLKKEYDHWLRNGGYDNAWEQLRERFGDDAEIAFTDYGGELEISNEDAADVLIGGGKAINDTRLGYTTEGLDNKREIAITVPTVEPYNESDTIHFGDAGEGRAVVWARFGETKDADGNRVLVIDEIQSKRHQDGREKGYKSDFGEREKAELQRLREESTAYGNYLYDKYIKGEGRTGDFLQYANGEERQHFREIQDKISELEEMRYGGVPDAPFEKNWHELAMKRVLRYAAENGYDKVAWTTGTQQAERYDIGDVVEDLYYKKNEDGRYTVSVTTKNVRRGNGVRYDDYGQQRFDNLDEAGLQELVGKEVATKIIEGKGRKGYTNEGESGWTTFKGKDLRIGGEGMKGFYDQILPRFMDKYGKKWGVKTHDVTLPNVEEAGRTMHAVDVTPEMRESVMQGQPKFSLPDDVKLTKRERELRDGLIEKVSRAVGAERVITDVETCERVLDMLNGRARLSRGQKRALETASVSSNEEHQPTVVSNADGAKVLENLDKLAKDFENLSNRPKYFIGNVAQAIGARKFGSNSQYATFETKNGQIVTIRLADHNASTLKFDYAGKDNGISIVITPKDNLGVEKGGKAHVVEFFYDAIKLRRAEGKPLADIVRSIEQALYSGEYKDTTGLAEREEVNANDVARFHRVYHGSGADFDAFDHSHMGEGEGAQAYGWGSYVTEVEGIGRTYAQQGRGKYLYKGMNWSKLWHSKHDGETMAALDVIQRREDAEGVESFEESVSWARERAEEALSSFNGEPEYAESIKHYEDKIAALDAMRESDFSRKGEFLYTVDIPEDNGRNYLVWERRAGAKLIKKVSKALDDVGIKVTTWTPKETDGTEVYATTEKKLWYLINNAGKINKGQVQDLVEVLGIICGNEKAASDLLHSIGFTGISYPTEYRSGGRADKARNYVIFDENDLQITDKARLFKTENGEVYGFTLNGKIYIDPRIATAETPVHEYHHLWAEALEKSNPDAWTHLKSELYKDADLVSWVKERYPDLVGDENALAHELFAKFGGKRGTERLREEQAKAEAENKDGIVGKARIIAMFDHLKNMLAKYWQMARDLFAGNNTRLNDMSVNDFADMAMADLMKEVKPRDDAATQTQHTETRFSLASETEDVPRGDQLFLFDDGMMESSGRRYSLTEEKESDGVFKFIDPRSMSDKEKQERGENLRTAKAISVKPEQIVATKEKSARKVAEEWWDNNVGEPKFYETEIGVVEINRNSVESSLAHRYSQKKLDAITSLSDGFSNAVYLGTLPDGMRQEGVKNHYFAYPILYDGKRNYVFCRALHDNNTNRLYVHEVFLEEGIEKGNTLQTAASQPHGGISLYRDILANVLVSDSKSNNKNLNTKENSDNSQRFSLPEDERRAEEKKNASAVHEDISHRGLREIVGEDSYDAFLDDVGRRLRDDVKKEVSSSVGREFLGDVLGVATNAQHTERSGKSYEARRRDAVGGMLGELADKPFEEFTERDKVLWQKAKAAAREALGGYKTLPDWFELGDNELRYMLWRTKEGIGEGRMNLIDVARDIAMRDNLGLNEDNAQRFSLLDGTLHEPSDGDLARGRETKAVEEREDKSLADILKDQSLGLRERITAAAAMIANSHQGDAAKLHEATQAINSNLSSLRKAMTAQRIYDKTTVKRVADLARVLISGGYLDNITSGQIKRLLSAVKSSAGRESIDGNVQKIMDIMIDNQLKQGEVALHKLETIKGSKVDAKGVEVQGKLDQEGVRIMNTFKKARKWDKTDIEESIADAQDRISSDNKVTADNASSELAGLQLALQYADNIKSSKVGEQKLRDEIRRQEERIYDFEEVEKTDANGKVVKATTKTLKPEFKGAITEENRQIKESVLQSVSAMQDAIRQGKIDRAQGYRDLVERLSGTLGESMEKAQEFRDAEQQRIQEIHHNANSDMKGRPSNEHYKPPFASKAKNVFANSLLAPLSTFEQFMRMLGSKSANGEGYLYNRFVRQWVDARQKEITGIRDKFATLDAKAEEIFNGKVKSWGELIRFVGKLPKGKVSFMNGGEMREAEINQGNLMYIYMVNKMLDGKMKLRSMGITEEDVANIEQALDPRLIRLADWLQDEFLVSTREEYNETHKRMFGASMAAIEDYFPLKILANARTDKAEDLDNPNQGKGISTSTGSIVKRTRNNSALDITNANALNVVLDHITEMEHWNAFAEFKRDINTLRTYKRFRNQIKNMDTAYGNGEKLWQRFNDLCQMATGDYIPPRAALDEAMVNIAKGVTAAKVSFRVFTALKQFLSSPAYLSEARIDYLAKNLLNPYNAWRWSMENLPIFRERWQGRTAGDPRLAKSDKDWSVWRSRIVELASRYGMAPNAFVDALTVSIGAHSIYQTKRGRYLREGYSEAEADKRAIQDAEIAYNQTQQSSESIFLSPMQVDRSWAAVTFTIFRNASMAYERQLLDALRNTRNNLNFKKREERIEFMKKQYMRDGISEAQAEKNARRKYSRQILKDAIRIGVFGYVMQFAWNLGAYLPYIIFGDDDDVKSKYWDDVLTHSKFGSIEGLTAGDAISSTLNLLAGEDKLTRSKVENAMSKEMPFTSDAINTMVNFATGKYAEGINDMVNLAVQAGFGVNPQSITDALLAVADACGDDPALTHEATICIARILQIPQSQLDNLYFDELGLKGNEVSKYSIGQLAERYAKYRAKRGTFAAAWAWNDEGYLQKGRDRAVNIIIDRIGSVSDDNLEKLYNSADDAAKKVVSKEVAKRSGLDKERYTNAKTDYGKTYAKLRNYVDLAEDVLLQSAKKEAKNNGNKELEKEINSIQNEITKMQKQFGEGDDNSVLQDIRSYRKERIAELGLN